MSTFGSGKNPPWARNVSGMQGAVTTLGQQVNNPVLGQPGVTTVYSIAAGQPTIATQPQYTAQAQQLAQVSQLGQVQTSVPTVPLPQPGVAMPTTLATTQVMGTVSYPAPRIGQPQQQQQQQQHPKQRVFTGTVTKLHDNFGFVDKDVFFQTNCVKGTQPDVGDRVLVEATFNANMPFQLNATRIQVLPNQVHSSSNQSGGYNNSMKPSGLPGGNVVGSSLGGSSQYGQNSTVPPLMSQTPQPGPGLLRASDSRSSRGRESVRYEREREPHRERREGSRRERERRSPRKRSRSPVRSRSPRPRSPPRRRPRVIPRYVVQIPKLSLDQKSANVIKLRSRYTNMYIPSDFFHASFTWPDAFPLHRPFTLTSPSSFHILHKDVEPLEPNDAVLEPTDADHLYSAKVMLLSMLPIEELYQKSCSLTGDTSEFRENFQHPTRLIQFLVGLKGKSEPVAIGGPWSPSLDGPNPKDNPQTLINTAIRTTKALTGIDLSICTQWYRFAELRYHRPEETHKGRLIPARVETVVIFFPDVWSCNPTRLDWEKLQETYKNQLNNKTTEDTKEDQTQEDEDDSNATPEISEKKDPTHYRLLDPKSMKVADMRKELEARSLNSKGLKSQLIARLTKTLKSEQEKEEEEEAEKEAEWMCAIGMQEDEKRNQGDPRKPGDLKGDSKRKNEEEDKRRKEERDKAIRERRFTLPDDPHILVHPSPIAKGGKFDCSVMSLSLLLDYRPEDTKEHSFEVSLFAELFNEMLMRDFGFRIFKSIMSAPEKKADDKKDDKKDRDKKDEKERKDSEKDKEDKSDDRRERSSSLEPPAKQKKHDKDEPKEKAGEEEESDRENGEGDEGGEEEERREEEDVSSSSDDKKKEEKEDRTDDDGKKKDDKKKNMKFFTAEPDLLLSFVYFDQTHTGYLLEKDVEEIIHTLGLKLSRSQVRKTVQKVTSRDMLHYHRLTDRIVKPAAEDDESQVAMETDDRIAADEIIARGNNLILEEVRQKDKDNSSSKTDESVQSSRLVNYNGAMVDISSVMHRLEKSEKARTTLEDRMKELLEEMDTLKSNVSSTEQNSQKVALELHDLKNKLKEQKKLSESSVAQNKRFMGALVKSRDYLSEMRDLIDMTVSDPKGEVKIKQEKVDDEPKSNGEEK